MDQNQSTPTEPSSQSHAPSPSRSRKSRFFNFRASTLVEKFIPDREKRPLIGLLLASMLVLLLPAWVYGYVAFYVSETGANPFLAFVAAFLGHAALTLLLIFVISKFIDALNKDDDQPPHKKSD